MGESSDLQSVIHFLSQLKRNNNKLWFDSHRSDYQHAMEEFTLLVGELIEKVGSFVDLEGVTPEECIMRIYRDIRFSKDKTPYKTGLGAGIAPGGRKSSRLGFHLHVAPNGETMVAGGLWDPTSEQLTKFRGAIADDARGFKKIIGTNQFKTHFVQVTGEKLKTAPKGFPVDHPEMELLRLKQICVVEKFDDESVIAPGFPDLAVSSVKAMKPFIDYLNEAVAS